MRDTKLIAKAISRPGFADSFWRRVDRSGHCWPWLRSARHSFGYGHLGLRLGFKKYTTIAAHRVAWMLENGPLASDKCVCHKCDNPICVRPSHLFVGTQADNVRDMMAKGRGPVGERSGSCKLSENEVRAIRALALAGFKAKEIGKLFRVCQRVTFGIIQRRTWKHLK